VLKVMIGEALIKPLIAMGVDRLAVYRVAAMANNGVL
jgi:hypothetical protein